MKQNLPSIVVSLFLLSACGGGGGTPSAPTPTVQGVTVTSSSDLLFIGASESFSASASLSTGGTQPITNGSWGSDTPGVATVDSSGRVTGVGSGQATIFVDYQGRRGTKLIRGLPNYQGAWSGSYAVTGCTQTGDFARINFCSNFGVNRVLPTNLNLTQDRDRVQGRIFLGSLGGDATGPVQGNGQLLLSGAIQDPATTIETSWNLASTTAGRITGTLSFLWRGTGLTGDVRVNADIRDLNRTSGLASTLRGPSATGGSLDSLLRALTTR
jgi:hypothetical protein